MWTYLPAIKQENGQIRETNGFIHWTEGWGGGGTEVSPAAAQDSCQKTHPRPQSRSHWSHEAAETGTGKVAGDPGEKGAQQEDAPQIRVADACTKTAQNRVIPREVGQKSGKELGAEQFPGPRRAGRSLGSFQPEQQARRVFHGEPAGPLLGTGVSVPVAKAISDLP